ncbi:head-to-tail connector complex protein [Streptomyces phage Attoomi]|uniref:Head-to-tail connector complex protein n=1 Tax=Streptomyces phage Attoomi TaxID=2059881 RepID=A0A2H5BLI1_9CAUD|nr:head-to-tail connector complex protein [Streptomyces phage Attoomi]AUG87141.1 head-to-tail stopper [Streptomyces phage Attoomi]
MSLLDSGPDTVTVFPTVEVDDGYGGTKPAPGQPVTIRARVEPVTTTESPDAGYVVGTVYRVIARSLPAGPWSRVEWAGSTWAVVGEPERFGTGRRLAHDVATIRKR